MVTKWSLALLWGLAVCSLPALAHAELEIFSDSGIEGPTYEVQQAEMEAVAATFPGQATIQTYGDSVGGLPLKLVKITGAEYKPFGKQRPAVLISGSTHGNEYLNIADRLPRYFLENQKLLAGFGTFLQAGGVVYIIPVLNPDGYNRDMRRNLNNVDLNRDFDLLPEEESHFEEPETRELAQHFEEEVREENLQVLLSVDYHCCNGSLLFPWSYTRESLPSDDLQAHRTIAEFMLETIDSSYEYGSTGQVLGYYPRGTSKDYYYARYGALAFTFEGAYRRENQNFDRHILWWEKIFTYLVSERMR